jgi:hypothetical protein
MKWATHILWGAAVLRLFGVDLATAAAAAALHTAATDTLGHRGLRRNKYHDLISIAAAAALAAYLHNPAHLALGAIHVVLDLFSPGKLAVSWWYNVLWSIPPALILASIY